MNSAGGVEHVGPFLELEPSDWAHTLHSNLDSVVNTCTVVGRHMVEHGGSIINIASIAGLAGFPALAPYAVAKAGVISLTRTLAAEWARSGIRVNAIAPGWISTDLTRKFVEDPAASDGLMQAVPQGRWGDPDEVVGTVIYLAGEAGRMVTGACLTTDAGTTCYAGGPAMLDLLALGRIPV